MILDIINKPFINENNKDKTILCNICKTTINRNEKDIHINLCIDSDVLYETKKLLEILISKKIFIEYHNLNKKISNKELSKELEKTYSICDYNFNCSCGYDEYKVCDICELDKGKIFNILHSLYLYLKYRNVFDESVAPAIEFINKMNISNEKVFCLLNINEKLSVSEL